MKDKRDIISKAIVPGLIIIFLLLGYAIFLYGLRNGQEIAAALARPEGAASWSTSAEQTNLVMYGTCAFGGLWIVVSYVLFILLIARKLIFAQEKKHD